MVTYTLLSWTSQTRPESRGRRNRSDGPFAGLLPSAAYNPSKSALAALTVNYANELRKDGFLVNAACPGYVDTDSNNHTGFRTVAQGAAVLVRLATLGAGGPTAGMFGDEGPVPW